jgi:hypothetical protein
VRNASEIASPKHPSAMSIAGLSVCLVVLTECDPLNASTTATPSEMLIVSAPARNPDIIRAGRSRSSISDVTARSVGLSDDVSDRKISVLDNTRSSRGSPVGWPLTSAA